MTYDNEPLSDEIPSTGDAAGPIATGATGVAAPVAEAVTEAEPEVFTLELLHVSDQEAGAAAVYDAPRLSAVLNALRAEDLGADGEPDNTLVLSSGDAFLAGLFYNASEAVFGSAGIADIQIQNELGIQAISFGNHEFDFGTAELAALIDGSATGDFSALVGTTLEGLDFTGTDMPYLSSNIDFSTDANMAPLEVGGGAAPQGNVVTSTTVIAMPAEGAAMATGENGYTVTPIFTVGDTLSGTSGALNASTSGDYTPAGVLDGLGAFELDENTVRVLANHELANADGYAYSLANGLDLTGARVSYFDIDKTTKQIVDAGLAFDTVYAADGSEVSDLAQLVEGRAGFDRFCSSVLIEAEQFGAGMGLADRIYFTGEETGGNFSGVSGNEWALDVATGELWAVPAMGRGAWENVTEIDTGTTTHVAFILADDTSPFDADGDGANEAAPLFLYVGEKDPSGDFLARNGLKDGKLYVWVADDGTTAPSAFNGTGSGLAGRWVELDNSPNPALADDGGLNGYDEYGYPTQRTLWSQAEAVGAFGFSRPEDVATNPANGAEIALASTGVSSYDGGADTVGTLYRIATDFSDIENPTATTTIVYDGDADPDQALRSPDNLDWSEDGMLYVQEDRAVGGIFGPNSANPNDASILRVDPGTGEVTRVAEINQDETRGAVDENVAATGQQDVGNWESSGILDVSTLFGEAPGSLFLFDVQAHSLDDQNRFAESDQPRLTDGDLKEGGQLAFLSRGADLGEAAELIGVVGATTPTLPRISSPGDVTVSPLWDDTNPTDAEIDALAAEIQAEVDALLDANPGMNKVILLSHMQQIGIELALAERLSDVDIIVAGGSNTRLFDEDDRMRDGDSDQGQYPQFVTNAGGTTTAVVNTDGSYKYVGRLVLDFDADGNIIADSYDPAVSGAYATDAQGVADLDAEGLIDPEIQAIADAIQAEILATESNVFGVSDVFLNGNRAGYSADPAADPDGSDPTDPDGVRTQETNLGDLTADANLAAAREVDPNVMVSIKNGGGIRASIGETVVPPGGTGYERVPNEEILDADGNVVKPEGGISQNDIQTTLAFNNGLTLLTLTHQQLVDVLEHGIAAIPSVNGRFPQVSGVQFSYDETRPEGSRIVNAAIVDEEGSDLVVLVEDGVVQDPAATVRIVTLNFMAEGGDGYPFPTGAEADRVDLYDLDADGVADGAFTGDATFAADGTEQDAFAEYLLDNFNPEGGTAFALEDTGREGDTRIQNLGFREDSVLDDAGEGAPQATHELGEIGIAAVLDSLTGEGGSEVVAVEGGIAYTTNGTLGRIDVWDMATASLVNSIDLTYLPSYAGVQSVAVKNGLVAAAVSTNDLTVGTEVEGQVGYVALIDAATGKLIDRVVTGNLPDMVTFTADGTKILVANEGEFNAENGLTVDPVGSVSIIDVSNLVNPSVETLTWEAFDAGAPVEGVRLAPGASYLTGLEPEYIAVTDDGSTAYVSLQEANAFGKIDLATGEVDLIALGTVDHSVTGLDANDDGVIDIRTYDNLVGLRMPDAIDAFTAGGETYIISANEGDGRGDAEDGGDEARVGDILAGEVPGVAIDASVDTTGLERLTISTIDGDTDGDGDIDVLHAFGGRSFTIFDADGNVVFDSGSEFERILADIAPERFNNDDGETIGVDADGDGEFDAVDNRSDAKGPEPEAVTTGEIDGELYAFIGLERDSGIMIYNITVPSAAYFVDYIPGYGNDLGSSTEDFVAPEVITFIPASESMSGVAQIAVAYEVSGDTVVYDLGEYVAPPAVPLISEFQPNPDGTDPATQTVELSGQAGTEFDLWLVSVENDGINGIVDRAANVTGTFDANGLAAIEVPDLENPSFTYILTDDFTGAAGVTDIDTDDDGVVDDLSAFGTILDAIGSADSDADFADSYADDAALGGVAFAYTGTEPELMFRDGSRGDWYAVNAPGAAEVFAADGSTVDPAEFDTDPTAITDSFGAVNPVRAGATPDLQITELWFGQDGTDLTADWIEVTNFGAASWVAAVDGALYYDDESFDPTAADLVQGIDSLAPGESAIIVIGQAADAAEFLSVWGDDTDLSSVQVGWSDGAGLGQGGDAAALFLDPEGDGLAATDTPFTTASFPDAADYSGQSYDVVYGTFSTLTGFVDMAATTELGGANDPADEPAIASPGYIPTEGEAPSYTLISEIQGAGFVSPLEGQRVTVQAVVTLVSDQLNGFFLQEEDADADGDAATSEGVFVYTGSDPSVAVGDLVTVEAYVSEYRDLTELSIDSLVVEAQGVDLPSSVTITLPLPDGTDPASFYETVEGMRVTVVGAEGAPLTVTDTYTPYGEVGVTSGAPLLQPTQLYESFTPEAEALAESNARDFLLFENAEDDSLSSAPRVGDGIVGDRIEGVMHYSFDEYKVETQGAVAFDASVNPSPRTDAPEEIEGRLKVASFNVLNYFTTLTSENPDARGADTEAELADQTAKIVAAISAIDADILGLIEIENDLGGSPDEAVAALVAALNAEMGAGTYDYIATGQIGTDAIKQAILYKPASVAPIGDYAVLDTAEFTDPLGSGSPLSRPAIAQSFEEVGTGEVFTVSVNHLKSKGSPSGVEGDDSDVEGSAALTRVEAVKELADWLASDPTGSGDPDQLTIGDFNAYAMERAIQAIEDEGFTSLAGEEATSYQFDGRLGTLDYAFANESLLDQVAGTTIWNVNSLEAYAQQYSASQFALLGDPASPYGSSDHDPVIVGLNLESEPERNLILSDGENDRLIGTEEADILDFGTAFRSEKATGLGGADVFKFDAAAFEDGKRGIAQILDYTPGEDMIDLDGADFVDSLLRETPAGVFLTMEGDMDKIIVRGVASLDEITFVDHLDAIA